MIFATLGPSSLNRDVISAIKDDVDIFRLNLSHVENLKLAVAIIRENSNIAICLDTDSGKYHGDKIGITNKDLSFLKEGYYLGVRMIALSFAESSMDVTKLRKDFPSSEIVAKIESASGLKNVAEISRAADALLIDRGDLSRQVPIYKVAAIQKRILKDFERVYVATNMMDVLANTGKPSTGEVNDVYSTLADGAKAIVLAGETAIGKYPIETVKMVKQIMDCFRECEQT